MKNKLLLSTFILFLSLAIFASKDSKALNFDKLPVKQSSNQWSVQIGMAEKGKNLVKPVKGKFHTYSIKIDKIGTNVDSVYITLYRNEPNSIRKYALHSCPPEMKCNDNIYKRVVDLAKVMNMGVSYKHKNFLLAEKSTELEVEIIWTENNEGRPLKETFIFTES